MCETGGGEWQMDDYRDGLGDALNWWRAQAIARSTDFPLGGRQCVTVESVLELAKLAGPAA
jgi:hypothetical protein